jgi:hypothetical protein
MTKHPFHVSDRRAFMRLLAATGSLAFLPSLGGREARAQASAIPKRILFMYGMGSIKEFHSPRNVGTPTSGYSTQFDLGELHAPLAQYKNDLIITDGLDMRSIYVDPIDGANGHVNGGSHALTANRRLTDSLSSGVSIDQYIARELNRNGAVTRYPMWQANMYGGTDGEGGPSYTGSGQVNPRVEDLTDVLARFPSDLGDMSDAERAAAAARVARRRASLEYALSEYSAVMPRLGRSDREKLGMHAQNLRELSTQIDIGTSAECQPPASGFVDEIQAWRYREDSPNAATRAANVLAKADMMSRLFVSAFSCDLTRVGLLHLPSHDYLVDAVGFQVGMFGGVDGGHDLVHKTASPYDPLWNNAEALDMHKRIHIEQSRLIANIIGYMKAIPEADGQSLFDHTAIVYVGQLAQGNHNLSDLPWYIAGSCGGYFKTGRYVRFAPNAQGRGRAHNDFFVSLANAMGIQTNVFGDASVCGGPLPGLT